MNFSRLSPIALVLVLVLGLGGCQRRTSDEEKKARGETRRALQDRSYATAIPLARRVLHFAPNDNGAWARLAQAQAGLRDRTGLRQTLTDWRAAVKQTSGKYDEYRGDLALAYGHRAEALAAWTKAVAPKDRKARVFSKIARLEEQNAHWGKAIEAWSAAIKSQDTAVARIQRTICYRHLHDWDAALADLHRAEQITPNLPIVRQQATLFARLGKFLAEVREIDKQLATLPNDFGLLADRALLFLRAEDADLALDDATRASQLSRSAVRPKLFITLAEQTLGRATNAEELPVRNIIQLDALSPEFLQTISRLDAEIAVEPKSADLRIHRAWQLNEVEQPGLALADAEAAIELDPKSAGAYAEASYALAKLRREPEAYDRIRRATDLDPNFSTAWQYRGELEMRKIDYLAAIESLTRALAINQTAAVLAKREECYRKLGLLVKAEEDHQTLEQIRARR